VTEQLALTPKKLLETIRLLDVGVDAGSEHDAAEIEYLVVMRWNADGQGGHEDEELGRIFRRLLRRELDNFDPLQIGHIVLAELDARG
jgi:hypothetical protein